MLKINTHAHVNHSTNLSKASLDTIKSRVENMLENDEMTTEAKWAEIESIVDLLPDIILKNEFDQKEISQCRWILSAKKEGKRVSKPNELINVLYKVTQNLTPKKNGGSRARKTRRKLRKF